MELSWTSSRRRAKGTDRASDEVIPVLAKPREVAFSQRLELNPSNLIRDAIVIRVV